MELSMPRNYIQKHKIQQNITPNNGAYSTIAIVQSFPLLTREQHPGNANSSDVRSNRNR